MCAVCVVCVRLSGAGGEVLRVLLRQVFEGVALLHDHNITHRDLKASDTETYTPQKVVEY